MTTIEHERHAGRRAHGRGLVRGFVHGAAVLILSTMLAAFALHWAWTSVAEAAFHAPALRYSDALAVSAALALLALACGAAWRVGAAQGRTEQGG